MVLPGQPGQSGKVILSLIKVTDPGGVSQGLFSANGHAGLLINQLGHLCPDALYIIANLCPVGDK